MRSTRDLSKVGDFFKKTGQAVKKEAVKIDQGVKKEAEKVNEKVLVPIKEKTVDLWGKAKADALHLWLQAKCAAVNYAGEKMFEEGGIKSKECSKQATKGVEYCQELGGGPEDPFADACAVLVEGPGQDACVKYMDKGLEFTIEKLKEATNC